MSRFLLVSTFVLCSLVAFGEEPALAPPLRALPPETIAIAHMPSVNQFIEQFRGGTRLGELWMQSARAQKLLELIERQDPTGYAEFVAGLGEGGFKIEDAYELFAGPAGAAVAAVRRDTPSPTLVVMAWAEPGGDITDRLFRLMDKTAETFKDDPEKPKLEQIEMHGLKVYHWTDSVHRSIPDPKFARLPPEFQQWSQEQRDQWYKQRAEARQNPKKVEINRTYAWITRAGKRLLAVVTLPTHEEQITEVLAQPDAKVDFGSIIGLDDVARLAAGYIGRNLGGDGKTEVAGATWYAAPELQGVLPAGTPAFEGFIDTKPVIELLTAYANRKKPANLELMKKWWKAAGLESVGPLGMRWTIEGTTMRFGGILVSPAPRSGLMTLFDFEPMAPDPPSWVNSQTVGYSHWVLDLEKVYTGVKAAVMSVMGEAAGGTFQFIEMQAMQNLQVELPALLAALGSQIRMVQLQSQKSEAPVNPDPAARLLAAENQDRVAFVWQLRNEEIVAKLFELVKGMVPMMQGAMKLVDEQGFQGVRFEEGPVSIAAFLGRGMLVIAVGQSTGEEVLAALRAPGESANSLSATPWFARARELTSPAPSFAFTALDYGVYGATLYQQFWTAVEAEAGPESADLYRRLRELFPSDKEMENTVGAAVFLMRSIAQGIESQAAFELKPADKK